MIRIKNLSKNFGGLKILSDINLSIEEGEFVVLLGPNGCGKSTILRIIAGLEKSTSGEMSVSGEVGFVFQEPALFPWRNVEQNVGFGLEIKKVREKKKIVSKYIGYFGLRGFEKYYPRDLSGGMKQKVVLARTIATNPSVVLMDEPFSNMDIRIKKKIEKELLDTWKKIKKTVIFVTHDIKEAVFLADRIILFSRGKPSRIIAEFCCDDVNNYKKIEKDIKKILVSK